MAQVMKSTNVIAPKSYDNGTQWAVAIWDYAAREDNEVSFRTGDILEVISLSNEDWYEGRIRGRIGFFPANRVQMVVTNNKTESTQSIQSENHRFSPRVSTNYDTESNASINSNKAEPAFRKTSAAFLTNSCSNLTSSTGSTSNLYSNGGSNASQQGGNPGFVATSKQGEPKARLWNVMPAVESTESPFSDSAAVGEGLNQDYASGRSNGARKIAQEDIISSTTLDSRWDQNAKRQNRMGMLDASKSSGMELMSDLTKIVESFDTNLADDFDFKGPETMSHSFEEEYKRKDKDEEKDHFRAVEESIDVVISRMDCVPAEVIRKEGWLNLKQRRLMGGREPKKEASWQTLYAFLCVGHLICYRDEPSKTRKKSEKSVGPICVMRLNCVTTELVGKDQTKKKGVFQLGMDDGSQWLIQPDKENDFNEWMDAMKDNSKDRSTIQEYENAIHRLKRWEDPGESNFMLQRKGKDDDSSPRRSRSRNDITQDDSDDRRNKVKTKIGNFLFKRPTVDKLKEKGIIRDDDLLFGGNLESQALKEGSNVPHVVTICVSEVDRRGLLSQGIYRLSGNASTIQKIRFQFNEQKTFNLEDEGLDINVVASLLKLFFRELDDSLIPTRFYDQFIAAARVDDYNERLCAIKTLVQALPKPNYDTLEFISRHLCRVAAESEENKMEPSNLAIVFGPTLIRAPETEGSPYPNIMNMTYQNALIESILLQTDWIFDKSRD